MAVSITSKFSPGNRAYIPLLATADILPVAIVDVYLDDFNVIFYDIMFTLTLKNAYAIPEEDLMTFDEAKTTLLTYLQNQITKINNLSGI